MRENGNSFFRACLDFLDERIKAQSSQTPSAIIEAPHIVPLSLDITRTFLRALHEQSGTASQDNNEYLHQIYALCNQVFPNSANHQNTNESVNSDSITFPPDLEEEALSHYEKIYKGELTVAQVIDLLKRYKLSKVPREQDIFKCMIQYLFDEYKYFPRYPERQLLITGVLFGALIQNQIVTSMALGIALRYVLEALRQQPGSLLFKFGLHSLAQFQQRLAEWPQYCSLLFQIDHLHQACPEIIYFIKSLPIELAERVETSGGVEAARIESKPSIFKALSLTGIVSDAERFQIPNENIQDKLLFIINNLSFTNLESKIPEMELLIQPQHLRWFCHYIVVKRASIEPNFHTLYVALISSLKIEQIDELVLYVTLAEIRELLDAEKTVTSSQERTLLKNMATWLGSVTLAKNKPIKHQNLSFKDLLLQGYDSKRLIVVIPFVCKVLEQCTSSKVFSPPNPWLMGLVSLLSELYHFAELKLNLKFEIEVMCKNIKLAIADIEPSTILRNRHDLGPAPDTSSKPQDEIVTALVEEDTAGSRFSNLASMIVFNPNIAIFNSRPALKRIVQISIDRSIREVILSTVVERSVTIAVIATRELVIKDFALEPNEDKMRKSAHFMVQTLSGSLASVSSREPLRISMVANLKSLLQQNGFTEQTVPEQVIYVIVSDNLDLACSFMEKAAAEKSVDEVDDSLSAAYINRKKHRERNTQPYYDAVVFGASRYPSALPEALRLRTGGLTTPQLSVYEDFSRIKSLLAAPDKSVSNERSENELAAQPSADDMMLVYTRLIESFGVALGELDALIKSSPNASLSNFTTKPEVQNCIQQLLWLLSQASYPEEVCDVYSQKLVQLLYKHQSACATEVYIWLLLKLLEISPKLAGPLKDWFLHQDDDRKLNVQLTISFLKADIILPNDLDMQLARFIESGKQKKLQFTVELINQCVFVEKICSYVDFVYSVESLSDFCEETDVDG